MSRWRNFQKHRYLIAATGTILAATFALVLTQYRSVRQAERQAHAILQANLDLSLLALVSEAKRDMVERADHITHSIYQRLVRERDLPGLQRAFTRAARRFSEVQNFYVVFFEGRREDETWRVLRYIPPDARDPRTPTYLGAPLGRLLEEADSSEALRRAWLSVRNRAEIATYTVYAPTSLADPRPRQIFFHPVYESASMERQNDLDRVGLVAFTAEAESYPAPNYLRALVNRFEGLAAESSGSPGNPAYQVSIRDGAATRVLAATAGAPPPLRLRGFEPADRLFPNLSFGVAPRDPAAADASNYTRLNILLGLCAAGVTLIGLILTWRATRREMRVAQLKSDFLASISHELKTPLTAIRAFGDLIYSGRIRDSARVREYGGLIKAESDRLTALINNILELSRLERGVRRYRLEEGFLCEAVEATVEVFRHSAEADGYTIEVEAPSPIRTRFDESALRQALLNLLSNAAKYSGASQRIQVAVKCDESEATIEVRDFGVGIPRAEQRHIFMAFHRASQSETQAGSGAGLGLAIVREVAQAHGGEVSVESELGAGATFRVRLPLLLAGEEQTTRTVSEENGNGKYPGDRRRTQRGDRFAR
jgi:signal transduction histidine kinase